LGPLTYGETADPLIIPIDMILTDASDRDTVRGPLAHPAHRVEDCPARLPRAFT
jgi:hypothetical protein